MPALQILIRHKVFNKCSHDPGNRALGPISGDRNDQESRPGDRPGFEPQNCHFLARLIEQQLWRIISDQPWEGEVLIPPFTEF